MNRQQLLADLWDERHNGIAWAQSSAAAATRAAGPDPLADQRRAWLDRVSADIYGHADEPAETDHPDEGAA